MGQNVSLIRTKVLLIHTFWRLTFPVPPRREGYLRHFLVFHMLHMCVYDINFPDPELVHDPGGPMT